MRPVLLLAVTLIVCGCRISGTAQPDPAAIAAASAVDPPGSAPARASAPQSSTQPVPRPTIPGPATPGPTAPGAVGTIEDHSTSQTATDAVRTTVPTPGPTLVMADDGFPVSVMVTTLWCRALMTKGARVGIRTIEKSADQLSALRAGKVDVVQQYNSGLLGYLDRNADIVGQADVDAHIAAVLPAGLSVLRSTPAKDDVQLTVSAATAALYQLHSVSDLGAHLADLTLLLPDDNSASAISRGLAEYYGLTFATTAKTDFAGPRTIEKLRSTRSVGLMVASQYQIDDNRFTTLADPRHLFLTENFIPVIGGTKVTAAMKATLDAVSARLSTEILRQLRKKVATGQGSYADIADRWLASIGIR